MNILIIEDNRDIAANLADYLEPAGHELDFAIDGKGGLKLAAEHTFDVIVLDLMLPGGMDGIEVCRRLRQELQLTTPVLMLTARDQLDDKLSGFNAGTDDYLVKPFSIRELEARLLALARRREDVTDHRLTVGDLILDTDTLQAERQGHRLDINPVQRKLLTHLMKQSHRVVNRAELEQLIWGDSPPDTDILRTHIYALRRIIDRPFDRPLLHTVHGIGYRLSDHDGDHG
ncbi:MAG: response regulator transcription factor [Pseudomonadota bacterium]